MGLMDSIFSGVSAAFGGFLGLAQGFVGGVFGWLHDPQMAIAGALALLIFAAIAAWRFMFVRILPVAHAINAVRARIEESSDTVFFATNFGRFDLELNAITPLRRAWLMFRSVLLMPGVNSRQPIRYSSRAADYLHIGALEAGGLNFRFFQGWANYFLGFGVLISFLGLSSDLFMASLPVTPDDPAPVHLLSGMAFKVVPLICGMLGWLLLTFTYRGAEEMLRDGVQSLARAIDDRLQYVAPQSLLSPEREGLRELELQAEHMRTLSRDIGASLQRVEMQLSDTLPGRIGEAMGPLANAIDQLGRRLAEANTEALRKAVGELAEGLHARASGDIEALSHVLTEARLSIESAGEAMRDASHVIRDAAGDAGENLRSELAQATAALGAGMGGAGAELAAQLATVSRQAEQAFAPLPQRIGDLGDMLQTMNTRMAQQGEAFASVISLSQAAVKSLGESISHIRDAVPGAARADDAIVVSDLTRASRDISSSAETAGDARRLLKRLSDKLHQPATRLMNQDWSAHLQALGDTDAMLTEIFENFQESATQQRTALDAAIAELEGRIERLFRDLDSGAERLESAIGTIRSGPGSSVIALRDGPAEISQPQDSATG